VSGLADRGRSSSVPSYYQGDKPRPGFAIRQLARRTDRLLLAGVIGLAALAPLILGATHAAIYSWVEASCFILGALWMVKLSVDPGRSDARSGQCRYLLPPTIAVLALLIFTCLPLPPGLLALLSPHTYQLYRTTLPGWPGAPPYAQLIGSAAVPVWRPLALAPQFAAAALVKLLGYSALLLVVAYYPCGAGGDEAVANRLFVSRCVLALCAIGCAYAVLGIVEELTWNGRILWLLVPRDWNGPNLALRRARGPFVDPDHFGSFLVMLLPTLLAALSAPRLLVGERLASRIRPLLILGTLIMVLALVLTLSRSSWIAAILATALFLQLLSDRHSSRWRWAIAASALAAAVAFSLLLMSSGGEWGAASQRMAPHSFADALAERAQLWWASLALWRAYPLFGAGLGGWREIFPHFQYPPSPLLAAHEAHNDYLEWLCDGGVVGLALGSWWLWRLCRLLRPAQPVHTFAPLFAALLAGCAAVAVQEGFDFALQIPANAVIVAIELGLALRIARASWRRPVSRRPTPRQRWAPGLLTVAMVALAVVSLSADPPPDLEGRGWPTQPIALRDLVIANPALARAHLALLQSPGVHWTSEQRLRELALASWLDRDDPYARDLYARALLRQGDWAGGLAQVTQSVFITPTLADHYYLTPAMIPRLSAAEQMAVATGFTRAVLAGYPSAADNLAAYYQSLERYSDLAQLWMNLAADESDAQKRAGYLLQAGDAYRQAGLPAQATSALRAAAQLDPQATAAWVGLARLDLADHRPVAAMQEIDQGLAAGADATDLYLGLYRAADAANQRQLARQALEGALRTQPYSFDALLGLGNWYLNQNKYPRAADYFTRASEVNPGSILPILGLGQAEEADFQYAAAESAYKRALALAPDDRNVARTYRQFERKLSELPHTQ